MRRAFHMQSLAHNDAPTTKGEELRRGGLAARIVRAMGRDEGFEGMTPIRLEESPRPPATLGRGSLNILRQPLNRDFPVPSILAQGAIAFGPHFWVIYRRHHSGWSPALN